MKGTLTTSITATPTTRQAIQYPPTKVQEAQERPRKRRRLLYEWLKPQDVIPQSVDALLEECLVQQVIPIVEKEIAKVAVKFPNRRLHTEKLGKEAIGALVDDVFTDEFKWNNGRLSAAFEKVLAVRTERMLLNWSNLPGFQSETPQSSLPPSSRGVQPSPRFSETPIPLPVIPKAPQVISKPPSTAPARPTPRPTTNGHVEKPPQSPILISSSSSSSNSSDGESEEEPKVNTSSPATQPTHSINPPRRSPRATFSSKPIKIDDHTEADVKAERPPSADSSLSLPSRPRTPPLNWRGRKPRAQQNATSPRNFRSRAHAQAWRDSAAHGSSTRPEEDTRTPERHRFFSLARRPYVDGPDRRDICRGVQRLVKLDPAALREPLVFHVDFTQGEIRALQLAARTLLGLPPRAKRRDAEKDLFKLLKSSPKTVVPKLFEELSRGGLFKGRTAADLTAYVVDLMSRNVSRNPSVLSLARDDFDRQASVVRSSRVNSLLLAREVAGHNGYGSVRRLTNFTNEFRKYREDGLELRSEWTNCAGDIATIAWVSNDGFICGTTEHSDSHNQQYNKPGNLVLGSCSQGTLRSYPDHRLVRPVVEKGENSTDAMRQSQDPWLYASVVSSDYDPVHDRAFSSGFDRTVKIWKAENSGVSMELLGTWRHGGNVNFVVASKHETSMVATAADVPAAAVRIYRVDNEDISSSTFCSFSCSRIVDVDGNQILPDTWAYFPATIQWGASPGVRHLLLVGYSPRSLTAYDNDIPEDRRNSGELCLWDGLTGERWKISSGSSLNVFEVMWHPTQDSFIAATSPQGLDIDAKVRTQIRIFRVRDKEDFTDKCFTAVQTLDCPAVDINELTIKPNSFTFTYITAGCTDGNTYVWDTARGDKPIHVLRHGFPIEEFRGDRESEDTGVKFTAWGSSPDRFYTGASDGVVKIWNVRTGKKPLVRDLLEVPAPVSYGMFSPDLSKLVIGDASGRVFLLSVDEDDQKPAPATTVQLPGTRSSKNARRPKPIIPHPEPEPPVLDGEGTAVEPESGRARSEAYLKKGQLVIHHNPTVGAVQGPNYEETGLFFREAHGDDDPAKPLVAGFDRQQQESLKMFPQRRRDMFAPTKAPSDPDGRVGRLHAENLARDLDLESLPPETVLGLRMARVDLDDVGVPWDFSYEEMIADTEEVWGAKS